MRHGAYQPPAGLAPAVLHAVNYERPFAPGEVLSNQARSAWVIDHSPTPGIRVQSGGRSSRWRERPAGTLHCYAPGTAYREDLSRVAGRRLAGTYLIYRDPIGVLSPLIDADGCAAVADERGEARAVLARLFAGPGSPSLWTAQAALAELVGLLLTARRVAGGWALGLASDPGLSARVDALLRARLVGRIQIAGIAAALGISPSSLAHRFRAETGETVMMRLRRLRVERAVALLPSGRRLDLIAAEAGFCDRFHLAKAVRRITGRPPSAWR